MSTSPEQFARIEGKVDLAELEIKLVVVIGVGSVGSQIAKELAHSGIGHLRLIDGETLDETNVIRHALPRRDVGKNKAEALTLYLAGEVPTLQVKGLARHIDDSISDSDLDTLLEDADLIVAATDERRAQRRIGARARTHDIAAIFPGLDRDDGGEVFVQRRPALPCFSCWDAAFRPETETLRGTTALNVDILPVLFLTVELCIGLLDTSSVYFRRLVPQPGQPVPLLFRLFVRNEVALGTPIVDRQPNCPVCRVEPPRLSWIDIERRQRSQAAIARESVRSAQNQPPPEGIGHLFGGMAVLLFIVIYWAVIQPGLEYHRPKGKYDSNGFGHGLLWLFLHLAGYGLVLLGVFLVLRGIAMLTGRYQG